MKKLAITALLLLFVVQLNAQVVTSLANSGAGSLRDVIAAAAPGATMTVSVTGTITLTTGISFSKEQTLVKARQEAGRYQMQLNAAGLSSGVYFYRLQASGFTQTKKMMLVK